MIDMNVKFPKQMHFTFIEKNVQSIHFFTKLDMFDS